MASQDSLRQNFLDTISRLQAPENPIGSSLVSYLERIIQQYSVRSLEPLDIINQATLQGVDYIDREGQAIANVEAWLRTTALQIVQSAKADPVAESTQSIDASKELSSLYNQPATQQEDEPRSLKVVLKRQTTQNQCYDEALGDHVLPLRMMQIPAGTFLMGSPEDELERQEREGSQHEVTLSQFYMGKYPITQAQWRAVVALPQIDRKLKADPSYFNGDLRPVEQVSWHDAVEFCDRLTILTNRQYRLPTEAEWEYACRAGTTTPFHFGETITTDLANYRGTDDKKRKWSGSYGDGPKGEYRKETTPVNQFKGANAFGLCDMHGDVWEWCQDHWHDSYVGAPNDGSAWIEGGDSKYRVRRGGSWYCGPRLCRSAARFNYGPGNDNDNIGFRVVCSASRTLSSPLRTVTTLSGIGIGAALGGIGAGAAVEVHPSSITIEDGQN